MNTKNIHELTSRLCQALDRNYDVVNMDAVMSVISTLEGTTITKEQLETTRLAKFINHLRRRTKNEHLARRAKSLLKKWREMVGIQQQSNSNQTVLASVTPSGSSEHVPFVTTASAYCLAPLATGSANMNIQHSNKILGACESQNEAYIRLKQPTSFENVLTGFGVTDNNMGMTKDSSILRHKLNQFVQQQVFLPDNTDTSIIDQTSNSNSQMSLILPSNNPPPYLAPIVIDIQDSNSGSNLIPPVSNPAFNSKISLCERDRAQSVDLTRSLNTSVLPTQSSSKSNKIKKEKRRKGKSEHSVHGTEVPSDFKSGTVLLDDTSSTQHGRSLSVENSDKYSPFVNDEESRLAYPEILSLLDNNSMSSMFPPESSTHPVDEQNKVALSASNNIRPSFNLSTSDLTFAGKFKQGAALLPKVSSNDLTGYNAHRCTTSSKTIPDTNFLDLHAGFVKSKFTPFRGVDSNSNDSNSNSQASQPDPIDVISHDKIQAFQIQRKQETLSLQRGTASTSSVPQQAITATITSPQQTKPINKLETSAPGSSKVSVLPEKKVPRKRGRKKGSKGVDSIIAKKTSLSSQMLMPSLGTGSKKVKTTKELYAEMQNRKLGITSTIFSPTLTGLQAQQQLHVSRPTSSCSEPSLQPPHIFDGSSTNATMPTVATRSTPENCQINANAGDCESTSESGTSDPSRDNSIIPKELKRPLSNDSNSNTQQLPFMKANSNSIPSSTVQIADIEKQLFEILSNLPPVRTIADIELKCAEEIVPCTCKITEVSPPSNDANESDKKKQCELKALKEISDGKNYVQNILNEQFIDKVTKPDTVTKNKVTSDETRSIQIPISDRPKLKKSIFDFDFDDDEDPLLTLKAEAAAANSKKGNELNNTIEGIEVPEINTSIVNQIDQHKSLEFEVLSASVLTQLTEERLKPIYPTYEVEEDSQCIAKQRFELQTQKITKFHIDALHNCFIPNVNGNWDDTNNKLAQSNVLDIVTGAADAEHGYAVMDGSVVPKYGSLVTERIRKDLSHINFSENFKSSKRAATLAEQLYALPFLGVARSLLTSNMKIKPHIHKTCHKTKVNTCDSSDKAVSKFQANKGIEGYKTHEGNFDFGVQIKSTEIFNTAKGKSKNPTYSYDHLMHPDSMLNLAKALAINADSIVNKNNNNVTLKDITIDVVDYDNDIHLTRSNKIREEAGQNLLAVAGHLDYGLKFNSLCQNNTATESNNREFQNNEEDLLQGSNAEAVGAIKRDSECEYLCSPSLVKLLSESNERDTPQIEKFDENGSSRRSSSSSNASLKQTQHSINLKLKRKYQEQEFLDINEEGKRRRKKSSRRFPIHKLNEYNAGEENKQPKIKRIKIAINGNMETRMIITGGSSNTSTNEDNEDKYTDEEELYEENEYTSKDLVEKDAESVISVGCRILTYNENNTRAADALCMNSRENCTDDQEVNYVKYPYHDVDADIGFDEYEDGEDYSGDYHEVFTRDISASSTGNNHIVLTIKKTPSKTNSPSNSLSVMSPVIANNDTNSPQPEGFPTVLSNTSFVSNLGNTDKDGFIKTKIKARETKEDTTSAEFVETDNEVEKNPQSSSWDSNAYIRTTNFMQTDKEFGHFARDVKLHHELFLPHELFISDCFATKRGILNVSSCCSSCAEDSECGENYESVHVNYVSKEDSSDITFSEIVLKSETDKIGICEVQHHWKCDSSTSPCSTNASCSTCGSMWKNDVKAVLYNPKVCSDPFMQSSECVGEIEKNEYSGKGNVKHDSSLRLNTAHSNEKVFHTAANGNLGDSVHEELPLENNRLLHSFNNIYVTVDKLEPQTNDTTINNDNIVAIMARGHMMCDNKTIDNATVGAKQQELMFPNKNCDDCNNIYNIKNSNNINLIRYINEPSFVTQVNRNFQSGGRKGNIQQQKGNALHIEDDFIDNTDADFIDTMQKFIDNDKKANKSNVNFTPFIEDSAKADKVSIISCPDRAEKLTQSSSSSKSRCVQVLLSHGENRTGLRAVDEDVDDDDGNNCARIQQFKEWHQVLQLRSYNDELLTVLPYVVLD